MANLKEVRDRISSIKSTMQITKAMKMVSAAKLRRAQQAIVQMRPYSIKQNEMLSNIVSNLSGDVDVEFAKERTENNVLIVVVTSNRGLCGAFNSFVCKEAVKLVEKYDAQRKAGNLSMMFVGKKGYDYFKNRYTDVNFLTDDMLLFNDLSFANTATVAQGLMNDFEGNKYDKIEVTYGEFRNAAVQYFKAEQFLPIQKVEAEEVEGEEKSEKALFIFEPSAEELLEHMVPSILKTQFHKYLLDTHASEHGARMTAMDKATENADDLLKELKIDYNKARQEAITREISEIVGGVAALEG